MEVPVDEYPCGSVTSEYMTLVEMKLIAELLGFSADGPLHYVLLRMVSKTNIRARNNGKLPHVCVKLANGMVWGAIYTLTPTGTRTIAYYGWIIENEQTDENETEPAARASP